MRRLPLILAAALLAACGQTGPLYLPDEDISTPVETRAPAPAAPEAPAQAPAPTAPAGERTGEPAEPDDEPPGQIES
jgi:predicted small lipoprotein YifL